MPCGGASAGAATCRTPSLRSPRLTPCLKGKRRPAPRSPNGISLAPEGALDQTSPFYVPSLLHYLGGWGHRPRAFWLALGRLESHPLADELAPGPVTLPVYVCGLAPSGTALPPQGRAPHPGLAT